MIQAAFGPSLAPALWAYRWNMRIWEEREEKHARANGFLGRVAQASTHTLSMREGVLDLNKGSDALSETNGLTMRSEAECKGERRRAEKAAVMRDMQQLW